MGTWTNQTYQEAKRALFRLLEEIKENGKLPSSGEYNYYVIWGKGNERWIEIPDQILDDQDTLEKVNSYPFVIDIKRGEIGYNFYESAFIHILI